MTNVPVPPEKHDETRFYTRNLPVLVGSAFLLGGAYTFFNALFQPLVLILGGTIAVVGVMVSISELSMLVPMLLFGEYSDAVGRRRPMVIASLLLFVAGLLFVTATHWIILIVPALLTGVAFSLNQPAANAATAESVPSSRRGRAFAYRSAGRLMAGVIPAILGIMLVRRGAIQNAFFLFTIFVAVNFGLIYFLLTESLPSPRPRSSLLKNIRKNWKIPPKLKNLYFYVVITDSISYGVGWHIIYGLLVDFQGVTSQSILWYTLVSGLTGGLIQFGVAGRVVDKSRKWSIVLSDSIAVPSILICAIFPGELTFLGVFLIMGLASSFWGPAVQSFVVEHAGKGDRIAAEFGKLWGFRGISSLFPPILGGFLAEKYGYQAPLLFNVFAGLISISVAIFFIDRGQSTSDVIDLDLSTP